MKRQTKVNTAIQAKDVYEGKVALKTVNRAGHCPNPNGHVHEILYKDAFNANPLHNETGKRLI